MKFLFNRLVCSTAFLGCLAFSGSALAQDSHPDKAHGNTSKTANGKNRQDQQFAMNAARGSMAEIQLGQLASQRAAGAEVKQFGQRMVDDHGKATADLKAAASQSGIALPTGLDPKHRSEINRLSKLSGEAFDQAYMRLMVAEHKKDVAEFQRQADSGSDPNLKQFAQSKLPTLQEHLKQAQEIAGRTGNSADRTSTSPKSK